jgi:uncharacterized protein DUF3786
MKSDNYQKIVTDNLGRLYSSLPEDLEKKLPAKREGHRFIFKAFGEECVITPEGIYLGSEEHAPTYHILITLYALHACPDAYIHTPFKAFKEFQNSMPYAGAFATHTENPLVSHVTDIKNKTANICDVLGAGETPPGTGEDFAFTVYPLPKIALCYIFYEADDDFPASVTCLFSNNAHRFLPIDGLADVGEYTSKKILKVIGS